MSVSMTVEDGLGVVVIDRPKRLNALDLAAYEAIKRIVKAANADHSVRGLLFTAAGGRAFSAGADINDLKDVSPEEASRRATWRRDVFQRLADAEVPSVAVIDGLAMGGGVELALACTFRLATRRSKLSLPEIRLGLLPGAGATQRLPRLIGQSRALDLMLSARQVDAEEALQIGLIDGIVKDALPEAKAFAARWIPFSRTSIAGILEATRHADLPIREGLAREGETLARLSHSPDGLEGVAAFLEKRAAVFNRT